MLNKLKKIFVPPEEDASSVEITDPALLRRFLDNPGFPHLISFPRTGSHWLRLLMELYFEKPSLVRSFYFKDAQDFTCYHRHDVELTLQARDVICLYRHPVPTVYSQLKYGNENIEDTERIVYYARLYGRHLKKWLITENFTRQKTIITYERLSADPSAEFAKVCAHFKKEFDREKFLQVVARVSKESLKEKTAHDQQVVNLSASYQQQRESFAQSHAPLVMETVFAQDPNLKPILSV